MLKYVGEEISRSNPTLLADSALQFKLCIVVFIFWSWLVTKMVIELIKKELMMVTDISLIAFHFYYYDFLYYRVIIKDCKL